MNPAASLQGKPSWASGDVIPERAADILDISINAVRGMCQRGVLPSSRRGRDWAVSGEALWSYVRAKGIDLSPLSILEEKRLRELYAKRRQLLRDDEIVARRNLRRRARVNGQEDPVARRGAR